MNSLEKQKKRFIVCALVAPMVLLIGFVVFPAFDLIRMSFTNWDGYSKTYDVIGFGNYTAMFRNRDLWLSLRNNGVYFFGHLMFIPIELMFAVLLTSRLRAAKFYKTMVLCHISSTELLFPMPFPISFHLLTEHLMKY
uniref:carbohydrate ABC transporter permease n=1 Tax=Clostridium sp. NkU-1 TaxID=1095009 RepID=UPI000B24158B